jgi:hypothetical protein
LADEQARTEVIGRKKSPDRGARPGQYDAMMNKSAGTAEIWRPYRKMVAGRLKLDDEIKAAGKATGIVGKARGEGNAVPK